LKTEKSMNWHYHCIFVYVYFSPIHPIWVKYEKKRVVMIEFILLNFFEIRRKREQQILFFSKFS